MQKNYLYLVIAFLMAFVMSGCATTVESESVKKSVEVIEKDTLLVGVTPDFPPLIYKRGEEIIGIEADLAYVLAEGMKRQVQFVDLPWKEQIPALLRGEIDIVMAGMSMTRGREVRIKFSDHYMKSGLVTMMRAEDKGKYTSREIIRQSLTNTGVVADTTGEIFIRRNFPKATNIVSLKESDHAVSALKRRAIDLFIYDAPHILWLVSENEAELAGFWQPFNEEKLAWAVRRDDGEFLREVNNILAGMRNNGRLDQILQKWLPAEYLEIFR
jgi:ABC-type amino acid transport substrate-binding protein